MDKNDLQVGQKVKVTLSTGFVGYYQGTQLVQDKECPIFTYDPEMRESKWVSHKRIITQNNIIGLELVE